MPIKTSLTYSQIGKNLEIFKTPINKENIPFILLSCFGATDTIVERYKKESGTIATFDGLLIKKTLAYRHADTSRLVDELEKMKVDEKVKKNAPPILVVSDELSILAYDPAMDETYENKLNLLYTDYSFFSPIWGIGKYRVFEENDADVKAAYKMAKLHDEIRRENEFSNEDDLHDLNIFMSRLLFCFFAEDTGIFEKDLFTHSIKQYTQVDGSDLTEYLSTIFNLMENPQRDTELNKAYSQFPYVNGGLFSKRIQIPRLGLKARKLILECGGLNWKNINPDIFGSMIQAVVTPELRSGLGLHYTSVPNIMKLIGPLFLDELYDDFYKLERSFDEKKRKLDIGVWSQKELEKECKSIVTNCRKLLLRMSKMKFFDPACGSGNFLIITYKSLRQLENRILQLIVTIEKQGTFNNLFSMISISQFYGIEIDDFACETAILSLWLAEHQMNCKFTEEFGVVVDALPLKTNSNIHHGNACRLDWNEVCPHTPEEEVFVMGNPPYLGARLQEKSHKEDMEYVFKGIKGFNNLDYIACWFFKGAKYIKGSKAQYAFVSTNSICQGEQVSLLWPEIYKCDLCIHFAHTSFKWTNNAKYNAGVTCVIVGVSDKEIKNKRLFHEDSYNTVEHINPYLSAANEVIVYKRTNALSVFPRIYFGSMPNDGGFLLLDAKEKELLIQADIRASSFIRSFCGSKDYINGDKRYCLWITEETKDEAYDMPLIKERIDSCEKNRKESSRAATHKLASTPYLFGEIRNKDRSKVIIPRHSSANRRYVPIGYLSKKDIVADSALAVFDSPMWLFGVLTSQIQNTWVRVIGGRIKTDYRYSSTLVYNTFPFPTITDEKKSLIESMANNILDIRDYHVGKTLAELYDPDKMPEDLRQAHHELDLIVDSCYQDKPFLNDEERLECLFKLYEKMTKKK